MSACISIARTSASFMRQPPERRPTCFVSEAGAIPESSRAKPTESSFSFAMSYVMPNSLSPGW